MRISVFMILLLTTPLVGCNKSPEACIEMDQDVVSTGTTVTFTSCSKHALSYEWFMSGPAGAPENSMGWSDPQITNAFSVAGTYTITLNAYSKFSFLGEKATTTATLVVQ